MKGTGRLRSGDYKRLRETTWEARNKEGTFNIRKPRIWFLEAKQPEWQEQSLEPKEGRGAMRPQWDSEGKRARAGPWASAGR